jgi:hypothetical protein
VRSPPSAARALRGRRAQGVREGFASWQVLGRFRVCEGNIKTGTAETRGGYFPAATRRRGEWRVSRRDAEAQGRCPIGPRWDVGGGVGVEGIGGRGGTCRRIPDARSLGSRCSDGSNVPWRCVDGEERATNAMRLEGRWTWTQVGPRFSANPGLVEATPLVLGDGFTRRRGGAEKGPLDGKRGSSDG